MQSDEQGGRAEQGIVMPEQKQTRGRKPMTGPYDTREEFCAAIWSEYRLRGSTIGAIARWLKVSPGVVTRVIDGQEGKPEGWRPDPRPGDRPLAD